MQTEFPSLQDLARRLLALEADPNFETLRTSQSRTNMFRIVGTTDRERWHSAFWGWILDPEGSHGLGDFAARRLLLHATTEDGHLRGTRLEPAERQGHWHRALSGDNNKPKLTELAEWRVSKSATAPGPLCAYGEVTSRVASIGHKMGRGDSNRFDILLALQGERPSGGGALLTLFVVVEMKVGAKYDSAQLQRYSKWVHTDPSAEDLLPNAENADLIERIDEIAGLAQAASSISETWGVGVFLSPWPLPDSNPPSTLDPAWSDVRFAPLVEDIFEAGLRHPDLDPHARELLKNYVDIIADPDMEVLSMPPAEHRELVMNLYRRHEETFRIIGKVLAAQPTETMREATEAGDALDVLQQEEAEIRRAKSLTPQSLIDGSLAKVGDRLKHEPIKIRKLGGKPFDEDVIVELQSGDRAGFRLVQGPEELKESLYPSTGILKEVYARYGAKFTGSGNAGLTFVSGESSGLTLEQAYNELRSTDESPDGGV